MTRVAPLIALGLRISAATAHVECAWGVKALVAPQPDGRSRTVTRSGLDPG
jgi:hypothetical protein